MTQNIHLKAIFEKMQQRLLDARTSEGFWLGRLSSSPLATAVSIFALYTVDPVAHREVIRKGLQWLADYQQADGGWGDAEKLDPSNLSSTLLCYAVISRVAPDEFVSVLQKAGLWIVQRAGSMEPPKLAEAVYEAYGKDRTFAVPILTMCAMTGLLGRHGWTYVKPLPFEMALLPRVLFRLLKLTVVSYALPALIAIGQVKYYFDPPSNPFIKLARRVAVNKTLRLLSKIQPENGGFLEAAPLTSFVVMSLAFYGQKDHPVVQKGADFLKQSMRPDGSWPIDTNLSTWCTSLAVNALLKDTPEALPQEEKTKLVYWYLKQQFKGKHPFTGAASGGWGWTYLPGAVPDADDTAGALVALYRLGIRDFAVLDSVRRGLIWLLKLQNSDGGIPTFCRGWGRLEFDRSCPDITAHTISAFQYWKPHFEKCFQKRLNHAAEKALKYLATQQQPDGSWLPLWFGNPYNKDHSSPVYGTARVLQGIYLHKENAAIQKMIQKAILYFIGSQNADFGWGSKKGALSSIEETGLVIDVLSLYLKDTVVPDGQFQLLSGSLPIKLFEVAENFAPAPIGLYFAKLWYAETLYPLVSGIFMAKSQLFAKNCDSVREMVT